MISAYYIVGGVMDSTEEGNDKLHVAGFGDRVKNTKKYKRR